MRVMVRMATARDNGIAPVYLPWARTWMGVAALLLGSLLGGLVWMARGESGGGIVVRTIAVGPSPLAVGIDEQNHRAFVVGFAPGNPYAARVSVIDTTTGMPLLGVTVARVPQALIVDARSDHVFVANGDNTVRLLDARTGALLHSSAVRVASTTRTALAVDARAGRVFVTDDTRVSMLAAGSGRVLRIIGLGIFVEGLAIDARRHHVFVTGYDGASGAGKMCMLDARSATLLSTVTVTRSPSPGPMAVDEQTGRAFVIDRSNDSMSMVDTGSGRILQTVAVGMFPQAVAVDGQTGRVFIAVYSGRGSGHVRVLDARTGQTRRTVPVNGDPIDVVVDARAGRVFVLDTPTEGGRNPGSVSVLDATSGRVLSTVQVRMRPRAAAVDQHAGRLIVVGDADRDARHTPDPWAWAPSWMRRWVPFLPAPLRDPTLGTTGRVSVLDASR